MLHYVHALLAVQVWVRAPELSVVLYNHRSEYKSGFEVMVLDPGKKGTTLYTQ